MGDKHSALFWLINKVLSAIGLYNSLGDEHSTLFWLINKVLSAIGLDDSLGGHTL
jgi:hypothetical protein